jgi:hypothetical protein
MSVDGCSMVSVANNSSIPNIELSRITHIFVELFYGACEVLTSTKKCQVFFLFFHRMIN